jgi:hypothetical protein
MEAAAMEESTKNRKPAAFRQCVPADRDNGKMRTGILAHGSATLAA